MGRRFESCWGRTLDDMAPIGYKEITHGTTYGNKRRVRLILGRFGQILLHPEEENDLVFYIDLKFREEKSCTAKTFASWLRKFNAH